MLAISLTMQGADSGGSRLLKGRILDNEHNPLPGAVVILDGKAHSAVADADGFYSFSNLESGTHRLNISYLGFVPVSQAIVLADTDVTQDIIMSDSSKELNEVVVTGVFSGQQRAINAQKSNINVTNIVSADQIGKFPDSNIGDALKRISGINVQYDQGEARFGQVRGTPADFSSVTINGSRIPSAEGDIRNVQLDLIPSDMIQTIEVNKTLMPDQDGDAIGGSINLVTKNSPRRLTLNAVAGTGYNWISRKAQMNFGLTIGNRFFNDRLGIMVSASYNNAPSGSYNTEFIWGKDDAGKLYLSDYQIRQYYVTRERQSYSLSADWKFNDFNKIWFKGIFNNRNDWENRYRLNVKGINLEEDDNGNEYCSINNKGAVRVQTKGSTPDNRNARLERQRTMDFTLGGEHLFGKLDTKWSVNYAKASEERPNERYIDYQLKKQKFTMDLNDERKPLLTPQEGSAMYLNDDFSLKEVTEQQEDIQEKDFKFKLDFSLPLTKGKYGNHLRFGTKVVHKTKDKEIDFYEYTPLDEDGFDKASLAAAVNQNRDEYMPGKQYKAGSFISKEYLGELDLNNASLFEKNQVQEELATNFNAKETVAAGYLRFDQKLGEKWDLMLGLRLENTHVKYSGSQYDADEDKTTRTAYESDSYLNVLPSVLVKYDVNDDFKVRASFTNTIARPKYAALAPNITIKRSDNSISLGNPGLKPTISYNFDLSGEYYFKSIGLVSAGVFYKKINDFIVDQTMRNYNYNGTTYTKFSQPRNSGNADLLGVEVAYQRDFSFIAPALKCIGFYGTYTYSYSRVDNFNFEGRENESGLRLPGSPEHTANASLFFEKSGVSLRLSYNYASAFIDEMGAEKFYDRYYDAVNYMDANASYTFGKKLKTTFYAEATNLLNQPLRYYQGTKERTMQSEHYGVKVNAGVKINF